MAPLWFWAVFLFGSGCCIGSFLNVVIWRLPRHGSVAKPAHSYCPHCSNPIAWYDNIPLLSWLILRANCRRCGQPISVRYPLVELATGLLFLGLLLGIYAGPLRQDIGHWPLNWPGYAAALIVMSGLLAGSIIDLEHFFIPLSVVWLGGLATVALAAVFPGRPGAEWLPLASPRMAAWAVGGTGGLLVSMLLLQLGILPLSFAEADAEAAAESPPAATTQRPESVGVTVGARREVLKEVLFLLPVIAGGIIWAVLTSDGGPLERTWLRWTAWPHLLGLSGSLFGLLIGGAVVWFVRIIGTLVAGREAMGLGDVHLLAAAGALLGWGGALLAFFIAPFFGIVVGLVQLIRHGRRELPFGPYLSLGVLVVLMYYDRLEAWLAPPLRMLFAPNSP
ncbi:MAG: prepilin peptidase [Phycisphaerae bacterium]|nr:prepilin peptidase [Phycisphaerae bacterium]